MAGLAQRLGQYAPREPEDEFAEDGAPRLIFTLQLIPELAETCAQAGRVCFVDAHTGSIAEDLRTVPIQPAFENSPLSHHMTPRTLLAISQALYQANPPALLVSVRGYEFGFSRELSLRTQELSNQAIEKILEWLQAVPQNG